MRFVPPIHAFDMVLLLIIGASSPTLAQEQAPPVDGGATSSGPGTTLPSSPPKLPTGKERLGEKWMDEQRIDNCKVPIDKRGTRPRPDTCTNVPTGCRAWQYYRHHLDREEHDGGGAIDLNIIPRSPNAPGTESALPVARG